MAVVVLHPFVVVLHGFMYHFASLWSVLTNIAQRDVHVNAISNWISIVLLVNISDCHDTKNPTQDWYAMISTVFIFLAHVLLCLLCR